MKTIKNLVAACLFLSVTSASFANATPITKVPEHQQIRKIVATIDFSDLVKTETLINVDFMVNANNEIIVLGTNNAAVDAVLKSKLNYKKLDVNDLKKNEVYTLPIRIK